MPDFLVNTPEGQRFKVSVPDFAEPAPPAGAESMTHGPLDPAKEEVGQRVRQTGENLYEHYIAPAKRLGEGVTQGTLDVTDPQTVKDAFSVGGMATGSRIPAAGPGELGVGGGRLSVPTNPRVIRSHLDQMMEGTRFEQQRYDQMLREGRLSPENHRLATERLERDVEEARTRLGLPARSTLQGISATQGPRGQVSAIPAARPTGLERTAAEMRANQGQPLPQPGFQNLAALQAARPREGVLGGDILTRGYFGNLVQTKGIMEKEFADNFFNGAYDPNITMMRMNHSQYGKGLEFDGALKIGGRRIGTINREIYPDEGLAEHNLLRVDKSQVGFVKEMTRKQFELYQRMDIERVELLADIDVGSYAWAKYGWLPTAKEWSESLSDKMWTRLPTMRNLDPGIRANVEKLLQSPDPRHIWTISDLVTPVQSSRFGNTTLGKALLLDNEWQGTFNLKDDAQMGRFKTYVGQAPR